MITGDAVTYAARQTLSYQPSSEAVRSVAIAAMTTLISYQAAAILIDLSVGIKPRGSARVSDIQSLLLSRKVSPVAVFRSLFPATRGDMREAPLRAHVVLKLCFLLLIAPLVNVASVVLTIESTRTLSFADARFGGLAVGVLPGAAAMPTRNASENCREPTLQTATNEEPVARFLLCREASVYGDVLPKLEGVQKASVILSADWQAAVTIWVVTPMGVGTTAVTGHVSAVDGAAPDGDPAAYLIRQRVTKRMLEDLAGFAVGVLKNSCSGGRVLPDRTIGYDKTIRPATLDVLVERVMSCRRNTSEAENEWRFSVQRIADRVSFVDSTQLEVTETSQLYMEDKVFSRIDGYLLLSRRDSYARFTVLAIVMGGVVAARVLVAVVTRNDIDRGIGMLLRRAMGVPEGDSMLCAAATARYDGETGREGGDDGAEERYWERDEGVTT